MSNMDSVFPKLIKNIENLIEDEEGNIPGKKLLMLGTMVIILGSILNFDAFAGHRSHSSHQSHSSHSSHSSGSHGNHSSHSNHGSHESHVSHVSHTSHSNTASHSNSLYSAEGDVTYSAPKASTIVGIKEPPLKTTEEMFILPEVNQNIDVPSNTPTSSFLPTLAVPATTQGVKIDSSKLNDPSVTDKIER